MTDWYFHTAFVDLLVLLVVSVLMLELIIGLLRGGPGRALRLMYFTFLPPLALLTYRRTRWLGVGLAIGLVAGAVLYGPLRSALEVGISYAEAAERMHDLAAPALDRNLTAHLPERVDIEGAAEPLQEQIAALNEQLEAMMFAAGTPGAPRHWEPGGPHRLTRRLEHHIEAIAEADAALRRLERDQQVLRDAFTSFREAPGEQTLADTLEAADALQATIARARRALDRGRPELRRMLARTGTLTELARQVPYALDTRDLALADPAGYGRWLEHLEWRFEAMYADLTESAIALHRMRGFARRHRIE